MPGMHELSWRVDFEEFSLKCVGLAARYAAGSPPSTDTDFARPFSGVEDAGIDQHQSTISCEAKARKVRSGGGDVD